jgi:thiol-disulfide isomerase/thioredoxin
MSASPTVEKVSWRGAVIGGVLFFGMSLLVRYWVLESPPALVWLVSTFTVAGALVGHLGLRSSAHIICATCGLALGLFIGSVIGDEPGRYMPVEEPEAVSSKALAGQQMEIEGPILGGGQLNVKDWQGKIVLVDYWATWCPPCVAEMPRVKKAYDRFHKDGFEIVGVSLDEDSERLAEFVKKHGMAWPQIIFENSSDRGWNSPLARKYDIHGIPAMFLLDKEGRVISTSIRDENPLAMLEQLMTGVRVGLFPMGLFIGACIGGFAGTRIGDYLGQFVKRKPKPSAIA